MQFYCQWLFETQIANEVWLGGTRSQKKMEMNFCWKYSILFERQEQEQGVGLFAFFFAINVHTK